MILPNTQDQHLPCFNSLTQTVANIAQNTVVQKIVQKHNLSIHNITWEDTARDKGSCLGPNISDVTLRLDKEDILLPVIRRPNFSDETADIPISRFALAVGNETKGAPLKQVSLKEYLENKGGYIKDVNGIPVKSLLCAERDEVILTSAQYCILPLQKGTCEFNVHLNNYQSSSTEPGVLVIVASADGSSAQAIYGGTTALYFNKAGKAANYVAERLRAERSRLGKVTEGKMDQDEQERNALAIFQIPLKIKEKKFQSPMIICDAISCRERVLGMDNAVLSVGETHSDFKGITNAEIERDPKYPIRCTIQYYKVTDQGSVPVEEFKDMAQNIEGLYKSAGKSGSLVVGKSDRKTEWVGYH